MRTLVVRYSITGNNKRLADHICKQLQADSDDLAARRGKMTTFGIVLDAMFNRTPEIAPVKHSPAAYDLLVLIAPVWLGKIASPLRSYIEKYRSEIKDFAFISVCGGALGENTKVQEELNRLAGKKPVEIKQLYINDILPENKKGDMKKTSAYKLKQSDLEARFQSDIDGFIKSLTIHDRHVAGGHRVDH